jgi:hypothetical protein
MQRLHGGAGTAQLGLDTEVLATPAKAAAVTSSPTVETSLQTLIDPPDEDFVDRSEEHASDLSLAGFAWIAGTAIVLIIAAILVLFG